MGMFVHISSSSKLMKYILAMLVSFLLVIGIIPFLMKLSIKYNFTDKPTKRKIHRGEIPLCGGIAMFIGFFTLYFFVFRNHPFDEKYGIFIGALMILLIGIIDDYNKSIGKEFGITPRMIVQLYAAIIVYKSGVSFEMDYKSTNRNIYYIATNNSIYFDNNMDFWCNYCNKLV